MTGVDATPETITGKPITRRAVVKTAAWSVPIIAAAAAAPGAAASIQNASLSWTATQTGLLTLHVLDSATTLTAGALITVPTQLTLQNGLGAIENETASVTVSVGRPSGINITAGRVRGFGVYSFNGALTTAGSRTVAYQGTGEFLDPYRGFPTTTFTGSIAGVSIASNGKLDIPVEFGLAGENDLLAVSALATFPVVTTLVIGGRTLTALSEISVPLGAGIL